MRRSWQRVGCQWLTILGVVVTAKFIDSFLPSWANVQFVAGWICCAIVSDRRAEDDATEEI